MKYKKYPSYKDSGVEWLGELPESWKARRLGFYFTERREKVSDKDFPALSVTKNGIVPQLDNAAKTDDGDNRKKVCAGDFVINSRSDRKGSSGLSELTGSVSLINTVIQPKGIDGRFTHNLLRSYPFQEEFYRYGKGIVADLWSTNYTSMKNITVPFPPIQEQQQIANFLDTATAKIDTLIAKQERLIELLKEKRQAVISHAVTKGLDPDVKMKDSGVEWLGEVPEHWELSKLKHIGEVIIGLTYSPNNIVDENEGILVLRSSNLQNGGIYYGDNVYVNSDIPHKLITRVNDIVICSRNGSRKLIGKNAMIDEKSAGVSFGAFTSVFRSKQNSFIFYILNSSLFKYQSGRFMTTTINQLTTGTLNEFQIALPPNVEQQEVVSYLDEKTSKIDLLVSKSIKSIELLKEKRTALISAAVTGKIDVRDVA